MTKEDEQGVSTFENFAKCDLPSFNGSESEIGAGFLTLSMRRKIEGRGQALAPALSGRYAVAGCFRIVR